MFETMKFDFITNKRLRGRMISHWGTEYVDGVHVFKKQLPVYPGWKSNHDVQIMLSSFGALKSIEKESFEGVDRFWLFLNPKKAEGLSGLANDILATQINNFMPIGEESIITLTMYDDTDPTKFDNYTEQQIFDYVDANYASLTSDTIVQSHADYIAQKAIGPYVLLDTENLFSTTMLSARVTSVRREGTGHIHRPAIGFGQRFNMYASSITVKFKYSRIADVLETSQFIATMLSESERVKQQDIETLHNTGSNFLMQTRTSFFSDFASDITDYYWYKGQLRVACTEYNYLDRDDFMRIVQDSLDSDYKEEDTEWWEDLLAIVLFVGALLLVPFTGGASLVAFATYMGTITLVLTLLVVVLQALGIQGTVMMLGKIIQIVGIISTFAGVGSAISSLARIGLSSLATFSNAVQILGQAISFRDKMRMKKFEATSSALEAEISQQEKELADMNDKEFHLGVEDIKFYTKPLSGDNLEYEVDYKYEGTKHNVLRPSFYPATGLNIIT